MRQFTLLAGLLLLAPAAGAQAVRLAAPQPRADLAAQLATLDPSGTLRVVSTAADGTLRRLAGPLPLQGADLAARAADFATRFAPLFGADGAVVLGAPQPRQPRADGSPRATFLPQLVHGWEVQGAGFTLALDAEGRATGAHGWVSTAAQALPAPVLPPELAVTAALTHLGLTLGALTGTPRPEGIVALHSGIPAMAWRVRLVTRADLQPIDVNVDASSGAVLSAVVNRTDASGNIVVDGVQLGFPIGNGSGTAYASVKKALDGAESSTTLADLTLADIDEGLSLLFGTLTGRYCTVSDFDAILFNVFLAFDFSDTSNTVLGGVITEFEAFDHVNTYAWITRTAKAYTKIMGELPSDTCIPVIVNFNPEDQFGVLHGFGNAFFSPDDIDEGGPFAAGFFVFGDMDDTPEFPDADAFDDASRDPTIVSHEYFHAVASFAGLLFGDTVANPGNTPPRAVNEAIADYASTSFHKSPLIGPVFATHAGPDLGLNDDVLRDLSSQLTLPDNLFDTVSVFEKGDPELPEEHEAGEIFGCALWRLRTNAKKKAADDLIINSLPTWPQTNDEVGFPVVDETNAADAYAAFDFECFLAILNAALEPGTAKAWKNAGAVLGAFLAHGMAADETGAIVLLPTAGEKANLKIASAFIGSIEEHTFALDLQAGQALTITLTGNKADATQVDFDFPDAAPGDFDFPFEKVVNAAGTKVSQKKITVLNDGQYTLRFTTASGPGAYKAVIKVK